MNQTEYNAKDAAKNLEHIACGSKFLVETNEGNIYRITKQQDPDGPCNPRDNDGNLGTMVCFHPRYNLGDIHPKNGPHDWFKKQLAFVLLHDNDKSMALYDYLRNNESATARIRSIENDTSSVWILESNAGNTPANWVRVEEYQNPTGRIDRWFFDTCCDMLSISDMQSILIKYGWLFMPLYLMDHSGLSISVNNYNDPWDSGMVGWIYTERAKAERLWAASWDKNRAMKEMTEETMQYDRYLSGEAYGIIIEQFDPRTDIQPEQAPDSDFIEIESCWGFEDGESMDDFIHDTIGDYTEYDGHEIRFGPDITYDCLFCHGKNTVTGKRSKLTNRFSGICTKCGARYHK